VGHQSSLCVRGGRTLGQKRRAKDGCTRVLDLHSPARGRRNSTPRNSMEFWAGSVPIRTQRMLDRTVERAQRVLIGNLRGRSSVQREKGKPFWQFEKRIIILGFGVDAHNNGALSQHEDQGEK